MDHRYGLVLSLECHRVPVDLNSIHEVHNDAESELVYHHLPPLFNPPIDF